LFSQRPPTNLVQHDPFLLSTQEWYITDGLENEESIYYSFISRTSVTAEKQNFINVPASYVGQNSIK